MKLLLLSDPDMHVGRFYTCVCPGVGVEAQGQIRGLKSCSRIVGFANSCSWVTLFVRDEPPYLRLPCHPSSSIYVLFFLQDAIYHLTLANFFLCLKGKKNLMCV